jgi:hypothetical protein
MANERTMVLVIIAFAIVCAVVLFAFSTGTG